MNEKEYFDEIRRIKKRRKSEDDARLIIDAEKKREARTGEILEDKYVSVMDPEHARFREDHPFGSWADDYTDFFGGMGETAVGMAKGLAKAVPAGYMGLIWPEPGEEREKWYSLYAPSLMRNMEEAMLEASPDFPQTEARRAGQETVTFIPEQFEKALRAGAEWTGEKLGHGVGAGVYTSPNIVPLSRLLGTTYKGMFPKADKFNPNAFKSMMGEIPDHFGIDVRARHGTFLSEFLKVISGQKDFGYYSPKPGGKFVALLQGAMEAAGSMLSLSNPYYQTIARETGFSPTVV